MTMLPASPAIAPRLPASTYPADRRSRLAFCALASLAMLATGCDESKKSDSLRPSYERPSAPKADSARDFTCQARLAKGELSFAKDEVRLRATEKGVIQLADISVLGGPFEAPLEQTLPLGEHVVRLVVDPKGLARCVRLVIGAEPAVKDEPAGSIAIDSGTLVIADVARTQPYLRAQPGVLYAGFEGPAAEMEGLAAAVASELPTERVLPTFYRGTRPLAPTDADLVKRAILAGKSHARFMVEPRPAAWALVAALGDGKLSASDHAGERSAVLVDVAAGDGAYVVTASKDAAGKLAALTISLER